MHPVALRSSGDSAETPPAAHMLIAPHDIQERYVDLTWVLKDNQLALTVDYSGRVDTGDIIRPHWSNNTAPYHPHYDILRMQFSPSNGDA